MESLGFPKKDAPNSLGALGISNTHLSIHICHILDHISETETCIGIGIRSLKESDAQCDYCNEQA